ncbi:MAG: MerR family transcriptional regulator [Pseudomonadota bacterium]|nr:MerR family transcriptional regulator [Pseudomonadota bacterium]
MSKSPDAFRTISEVAEELDRPQHVLRFWETRFSQIKPLKRGGGRRYYRPEDVDLLKGIRRLLYEEGYTIRGLQRILKEQGNKFVSSVGTGEVEAAVEEADLAPTTAIGLTRGAPDEDGEPSGQAVRPVAGRRAVPVGELTGEKDRPKGIFGRFVAREAVVEEADGRNPGLSPEDRRNLQATLYELLECKRLLDQVRGS